ncbi:transketolase [Parabacteroides distasonis]|jgi:transketolase|uniref:transketolase n=1 Tax=Parabacteroides distasonis TaxID=823 RepID=UPI0018973BF8|nr:transketolase [Parabacteroides distasonis]MDB8998149.1 transketolase [Parabacteroides distasonis]MDB9072746.1 transketolase [Parabacteroides distasonis]
MNRKILSEEEIKDLCKRVRLHSMDMALAAGKRGAHISSSLSCTEIYAVLYSRILNYDLDNPLWNDRDRFIAGKEHARLAEFSTRAEMGFYSVEVLNSYEENDGLLVGHQLKKELGVEYSSMSLGMEMPFVVGKALIAKQTNQKYRIYCLLGDAECEEGSIWEAFISAAHYKLDNLTVIIDRNFMSVDGNTEDLMAQLDMQKKMEAFGWESVTIDGHDIHQLIEALSHTPNDKPYAIIAKTTKGKGVSFIENNKSWHQIVLSDKLYRQAVEELKKS